MRSRKSISLTKMPIFLMKLLLLMPGFFPFWFLASVHPVIFMHLLKCLISVKILHFPWYFAGSKVLYYIKNSVPFEVHESLTLTPMGCLGGYVSYVQTNCNLIGNDTFHSLTVNFASFFPKSKISLQR